MLSFSHAISLIRTTHYRGCLTLGYGEFGEEIQLHTRAELSGFFKRNTAFLFVAGRKLKQHPEVDVWLTGIDNMGCHEVSPIRDVNDLIYLTAELCSRMAPDALEVK